MVVILPCGLVGKEQVEGEEETWRQFPRVYLVSTLKAFRSGQLKPLWSLQKAWPSERQYSSRNWIQRFGGF
jgi:hypothetical protein